MPQLASGDVLLITLRYSQAGQKLMNTQMVEYLDADGATDDYSTFANQVITRITDSGHIVDYIQNITSSTFSVDSVTVQKIYPTRLAAVVSTVNLIGGVSGTPTPVNSAITITKRSINATRWGVGSWHQPGLLVTDMANSGSWSTTKPQDLAVKLNAEFVGPKTPTGAVGSYTGILWSRTSPTRKTPVTSFTEQLTIRTMHRRTVRVGE